MRTLPPIKDDRLLVGHATFDDAGVYRLSAELALVQTVDFFPPVVDDPYQYGQIVAANAVSDIYAMGGVPLTALSLVCFPAPMVELEILAEILRGGQDKATEAACTIVGGHSVRDTEIKFGLAVTGTIHPDRVTANDKARPGDRLFLTKPLGVGPFTVAYRKNAAAPEVTARAVACMATLNKAGAEAMSALGIGSVVHAATDVTGFGLLGHARNIAAASGVSLTFKADALPILEGALDFAAQKMNTGAYKANQEMLAGLVSLPANLSEALQRVIFDAETSGGLLISVAPEKGDALCAELKARGTLVAAEVGWVEARGAHLLKIV